MNLHDRWAAILKSLRAAGRHRDLTRPQGIDFSSNDYLGYGNGRKPLPAQAVTQPQTGMASRLLRGHQAIWEEVEETLAHWHRAEAALVFTSGYVANEGLLATVIEPEDWVASDQLNHASIIDGVRLSKAERWVYPHNDLNTLEIGLKKAAQRPGQRFVVTESLFGMEGDRAPLMDLVTLTERHDAHLIVDEAHATGCFGPEGSGLVDAQGLRDRVLATVHTGGKALGTLGAYVCGSVQLKELLVNRCRHLIFTTALPPIVGAWWLEAVTRVRHDTEGRDLLHANARLFRAELVKHNLSAVGQDFLIPVVLGNDEQTVAAALALQAQGFDIRAIRPPTVPPGTARLRVSLHADHEASMLREVADALAIACRQVGSPP